MSDEFDDADSPHAREAIRRLNEAVPELPYPADFDFDFHDDISFQHYENVLGGPDELPGRDLAVPGRPTASTASTRRCQTFRSPVR